MEKLKELFDRCKGSVYISYDDHKSCYQTVYDYFYIHGNEMLIEELEDIEPDVFQKMYELNTMVRIQYYPHSPGGFGLVYHYDIEKAIDEAILDLDNDV